MVRCGEHPVASDEALVDVGVLGVDVEEHARAPEFLGDDQRVHALPPEMARVEVDADVLDTIRKKDGKEIRETIVNPDKATRESALTDLLKSVVAKHKESTYADEADKQAHLAEAVDTVAAAPQRIVAVREAAGAGPPRRWLLPSG